MTTSKPPTPQAAESYAVSVVQVLRKHFPDLDTQTSHLAVDAITRQMRNPQDSFEFIVDDPGSARFRLKARSEDRRRVRLAYFPVIPPGSAAGNALEAIVNEKLASLLAAKDGDNR